MGGELRRPVLAFAVVSVLCVVLMIVSTGRVDAVLGVFDAPRPISTQASTGAPATAAVRPETSAVATLPEELTAAPVGSSTKGTGESPLAQPAPVSTPKHPQAATTTDRKADRKADKDAAKVDRKADKA